MATAEGRATSVACSSDGRVIAVSAPVAVSSPPGERSGRLARVGERTGLHMARKRHNGAVTDVGGLPHTEMRGESVPHGDGEWRMSGCGRAVFSV